MAHAWKACWVQALGGSNPPSSATLTSTNAGPSHTGAPGVRRSVSVPVSIHCSPRPRSGRPPACATSPRTTPVTCWYRAAIAVVDQPMIPITARSGTPSVPPSRSTSDHGSPSASPCRSPSARAIPHRTLFLRKERAPPRCAATDHRRRRALGDGFLTNTALGAPAHETRVRATGVRYDRAVQGQPRPPFAPPAQRLSASNTTGHRVPKLRTRVRFPSSARQGRPGSEPWSPPG